MVKSKKFQPNFKIISIIILLISLVDSYTLLKNEHFSQLFWFCNAALYLLAVGIYFENSMVLTGVLVGALAVQIPWVLDFLIRLFFGYELFGVASYMFEYGFNNIMFYLELDHLLIIPLSIYAIRKTSFNKNGWIFAGIIAIIINSGAYAFSSQLDNVNCVFYSCFSDKIIVKENHLGYFIVWSFLLIVLLYVVNKIIYRFINRRGKDSSS